MGSQHDDYWGGDSAMMNRRMGKGRRLSTLRKHVKVWERFSGWLKAVCGIQWPASPVHFAEYLEVRVSEPCGRTIPVSIFKMLIFMENAAEVHPED